MAKKGNVKNNVLEKYVVEFIYNYVTQEAF